MKIFILVKSFYTKFLTVVKTGSNIRLLWVLTLCFILWACVTPSVNVGNISWKIYSNSRYGFEFPYPSNWNVLTAPANDDGIALVSPRNQDVEIRGWASNQLPQSIGGQDSKTGVSPNFQTTQGLKGFLQVEVGNPISLMKLTLTENDVKYYWQGRSPSQEWQNYYSLFYYIAQQYRVTRR